MSVTIADLKSQALSLVGDSSKTYWTDDEAENAVKRALRYVQDMCVADLFINLVQQRTGLGYGNENLLLSPGIWKIISFRTLESDGLYSYPWTKLNTLDHLRELSRNDTVNRLTSTDLRVYVEALQNSATSNSKKLVTYPILLTTDTYKMEWIPYIDTLATTTSTNLYLNLALEDAVLFRAASRMLMKNGRDLDLSREFETRCSEDITRANGTYKYTTGIAGAQVDNY